MTRPRIFDHPDGEPEDRRFSKVAFAMQRSAWWWRLPEYVEPAAVSGECGGKR